MSKTIEELVKDRIAARHSGDERQLEVVFSSSNRILVEAPAGYGKTNTMVSRIAYLIATRRIPNPKRLLALTFSVNAAYKIKKDVNKQLPDLLNNTGLNINVGDRIYVSNYHGFCRSVLRKYGQILHSNLLDIDKLQAVDDSDIKTVQQAASALTFDEAKFLSDYCDAVKNIRSKFLSENLDRYNNLIISKLLPKKVITYNAILTLTLKLFADLPKILDFYHRYYNTILVDEFQDTNTLSYWLLKYLVTDSTRIIFLGDSLQRIYGFIGAVPNLLRQAQDEFALEKIQLNKNYRFANNQQMLQLDNNIRINAENPQNPDIKLDAKIDLTVLANQNDESLDVVSRSLAILKENPTSKVAILVKQRGININTIIEAFEAQQVPYFFGLFTDEDVNYLVFHRKCLFEFIELIKSKNIITKRLSHTHIEKLKEIYKDETEPVVTALIKLLEIFWGKLFLDFSFFSNDEKIALIKDTFENFTLKQYIEFVDANIIISTVHAAKGLEWDFVILPDMEKDSFPNYWGLCNGCKSSVGCKLAINAENEKKFLEELSVFYVAVTRAKKQVYFTASKTSPDKFGREWPKNLSCFISLPGIMSN